MTTASTTTAAAAQTHALTQTAAVEQTTAASYAPSTVAAVDGAVETHVVSVTSVIFGFAFVGIIGAAFVWLGCWRWTRRRVLGYTLLGDLEK